MAPPPSKNAGDLSDVGPHPSYIQVAKPYVFDQKIQDCLNAAGLSEAKDDNIRLQGIAWIENVRRALRLPLRTFNTAVVYFLKFRLLHPDSMGYIDAAAAALFTACKIEDTLKKSRDILCAAYNLRSSGSDHVTADDPMFEMHSKTIIGLERLMLEAAGFDFRNRHPQRLVIKLCKLYHVRKGTVGRTAYRMSLDLYRTFAPLKQTAPAMALACIELAGRLCGERVDEVEQGGELYDRWKIGRAEVMETLLDLIDLYTHHRGSTAVGSRYSANDFITIRIALNQEAESSHLARHATTLAPPTPNGAVVTPSSNPSPLSPRSSNTVHNKRRPPTSDGKKGTNSAYEDPTNDMMTATNGAGAAKPGMRDGTVRFMLDPVRAREEKETVRQFFKVEEEEYEVEVEIQRERR